MNWSRLANKALRKSAQDAITELNPDMINPQPIIDFYKRLYLTVIPPLARRAYNSFRKDLLVPGDGGGLIWDAIILEFLMQPNMANRITGVSERTKELFRRILAEALQEGLSVEQTQRRLRDSYAMSRKRALVISRTELGTATMSGEYVGMQQLQMEGYQVKKTWLATGDSRTRDSHSFMNGVTIPLNEDFNVNGSRMSRPLDPRGDASEVINCRCALTFSL